VFDWQAGRGFLGEYDFLFERDAAPARVRVIQGMNLGGSGWNNSTAYRP
jgi:hypothetical protein